MRIIDEILSQITEGYEQGIDYTRLIINKYDYDILVRDYKEEFDLSYEKHVTLSNMESYLAMKVVFSESAKPFYLESDDTFEEDDFDEINLDEIWL